MKRNLIEQYRLPPIVKHCIKCTMSNQRPRITFTPEGVCSACVFAEHKRERIDWEQREKELKDLCDIHRKNNGEYDVIVPCSGGKDVF